MAVMSAVFKGVDEISNIFDRMASSGSRAVDQWESANSAANNAFTAASDGAENAAKAMQQAASSTDYWTAALGNYDKGAMEAIYSTKELVDMGVKTQAALDAEAKTAQLCAQAADQLAKATETAASIQEEMNQVSTEAARVMEKVADSDKVSAETKENLARASERVTETQLELVRAQEEAARASEELSRATNTAGTSQDDMEAAAARASSASEALAKANQNATNATGELSAASNKASKEFDDLGQSGAETVKTIEQALVAAGLTKLVGELAEAVIGLANDFSEAEVIIVKATGATGQSLASLEASMLRLYAADDDSLAEVAGIIGELNTRLRLQGPELERVTTLFQDYTQATGEDGVGAVQSVTKVMKNWNVEVENTEGLLDKLVVAGQMSGASVSSLSDMVVANKATLQQLGYGLEESIALLSMFEYEGLNSSSIMMGFRSAVTGFASEGKDASVAMQEVIEQIASMSNESEATSLAIKTFGSRAGAELAYAIRNGKFEIEEWIAAVGSADGTLNKTANAATTLEEKWSKASNNVSAAFTNVTQPSVNALSSAFAGVVYGIGNILNKSPVLTAILTGVATALGIVAGAVGIVTAALALKAALLPIVTALTATFGITLSAAIWPITLIVAAIAALVAGFMLLFNWLNSTDEEYNKLSATSKQHYDTMTELEGEYQRVAEAEGENSEAALKLAADLETARAVYEANIMTMEEFVAQNDKLIESHQKVIDTYNEGMESINKEEKSSAALISKLGELSSKTTLTASEQQQMSAIVEKLNKQMPDLALSVDKETGALNRQVEEIKKLAQAQAEQQRQAAQYEAYAAAIEEQILLEEQLAKAVEQTAAAEQNKHGWGWFGDSKQSHKDLETAVSEQERLQAALDENLRLQAETESAWEAQAAAAAEVANATVSYEDAVNQAVQTVAEDMNALVESYDKAYEAARSSIDSTIGLFDTMATECELSINDMLGSMQSQVAYLETYTENLRKAAEYGLDEGLIASLSDGSAESAGYIDAIVSEMERLGGTTEEAKAFADKFNSAFQEVETAKDEFAGVVAEMETDFNAKMGEIESRLSEAIDNMNMEADAAAQAKATINAYVREIEAGVARAQTAASAVANATANALSAKASPSYTPLRGHAAGTNSAERGLALVGEEGPELIDFSGGERVYPADETSKLLDAANQSYVASVMPAERVPFNVPVTEAISREGNGDDTAIKSEKRITLEIAGSGEIEVDGGISEEGVLQILIDNLKPVLIGIVRQEVFEEGQLAYDY